MLVLAPPEMDTGPPKNQPVNQDLNLSICISAASIHEPLPAALGIPQAVFHLSMSWPGVPKNIFELKNKSQRDENRERQDPV